MLMGNLTRNPELKYTPSGSAVNLGLAVNESFKNKAGKRLSKPVLWMLWLGVVRLKRQPSI